tara:strand:+ start:183 stop:401 length:219 start_codon:yes stop_codon:yes gene_type:complete
MELNIHGVTECKVMREYHDDRKPAMPGWPPPPAFHVTHLVIVHDDGRTAKVRLFGPQRLKITTEGDDDGSTT